jgi:hypothetical protein
LRMGAAEAILYGVTEEGIHGLWRELIEENR